MKSTDIIQPTAISNPIAYNGTKNSIPENPSGTQLASVDEGFPYITEIKIENGGLPPERADFNGLFYLSTDQRVYQQNGGIITFNSDVSTAIGGYPQGAILDYLNDGYLKKVISLVEDNTTNFVDDGVDNVNWQLLPVEDSTKTLIDGSNATFSSLSATAITNLANDFSKTDLSNITSAGENVINTLIEAKMKTAVEYSNFSLTTGLVQQMPCNGYLKVEFDTTSLPNVEIRFVIGLCQADGTYTGKDIYKLIRGSSNIRLDILTETSFIKKGDYFKVVEAMNSSAITVHKIMSMD